MNNDSIIITEKDLLRLKAAILNKDESEVENLEIEIERATVVDSDKIPAGVVTMNSRFEYLDVQSDKKQIITLVFPEDANADEGKISILAPIGSALLGLKEDQEISWQVPSGKVKILKILKVHYQPENSGDWHL
jgi:regulator of nucleoside diphosphate kinase